MKIIKKKIFLTSNGLNDKSKKLFFEGIGKEPGDVRVIYVPTAGLSSDGARESFAIGLYELLNMGIRDNNIFLKLAIEQGLTYVGISAGSMYAAGNLKEGMHLIDNAIIPHWDGKMIDYVPVSNEDILLSDGQVIYIDKEGSKLL